MIELQNITAGYSGEPVLKGISMTAKPGQITTVIGRNGCGKSTLLRCMTGNLKVSSGKVLIDEQDISHLSSREIAMRTAYLTQGKDVPDISAGRLVLHGRFPYLSYPRKYSRKDLEIAGQAMEQLGISHLKSKDMAELSGGMRQNVYIAMALAQQAPAILMDEPTTYLDIGQQYKLARILRSLAAQGKTIVIVLHDLLLALHISDQITVIDNGICAAQGTPEEILNSGVLEKIYGIRIGILQTDTGIQYYYQMENKL